MSKTIGDADLKRIIVVGDRVLIKPETDNDRTKSGLYLPPGVTEKEKIHSGYVMKVGPGYPVPYVPESDELWREASEEVKYIPIQPREGDMAVYLQKNGYELEINNERFIIVSQSAILLLLRDEALFD